MSAGNEPSQLHATQALPWQWLAADLDPATYRPHVDPNVVVQAVDDGDLAYYVLKHPTHLTYLRLSESDYELWQLMDGSRTLKDLVIAYFTRHKVFAFQRIFSLVDSLKAHKLLHDKPINVYDQIATTLARDDWRYPWQQLGAAFIEHRFPVHGLDTLVGGIYNRFGRLWFSRPVVILMWLIAFIGALPFIGMLLRRDEFPLITIGQGTLWRDLLMLVLANTIIIFIHELAHALATKHYQRDVPSGGAMIYYGMPAFYVNTMDIWLEPKRHRIVVTWAGPMSGIFLGGLFSLVAWQWPGTLIGQFFFTMAFLGYVGTLVNLNPLLELDGYFMLVDALGIPLLRERAFEFIKTELWTKLQARFTRSTEADAQSDVNFNREEKIFTVYGLLSGLYTLFIIVAVLVLWNERISHWLLALWQQAGAIGKVIVVILGLAVVIPVGLTLSITLWRGGAYLVHWLQRKGFFEHESNITILAIFAVAGGIGLPLSLQNPHPWLLTAWMASLALLATGTLAATARQYQGATIQTQFWGLAITAALVTSSILLQHTDAIYPLSDLALQLATLTMALGGIIGVLDVDLRHISPLEKGLMAILFVTGVVGAILLARQPVETWQALRLSGALLATFIFLIAVIPTITAYRQTSFATPWLLLALGGLTVGGVVVWRFAAPSPELVWLLNTAVVFWAVGGLTYVTAERRIQLSRLSQDEQLTLSAEMRLRYAFIHFFESLFINFQAVFGRRRAKNVDDELDIIAVTANWDIFLDRGKIRDHLDLKTITVLDQAARYQEFLSRAIHLMTNWSGTPFITHATQAAYDSLPWLEREALGRYVLTGTGWGAGIAREFAGERDVQFYLLRSHPLFAAASNEMLDQVLAAAQRIHLPTGRRLLLEGAPFSFFALVANGELEMWRKDARSGKTALVGDMHRGDALGGHLFTSSNALNAQATYQASVPTDLLLIDRRTALRLVKNGLQIRRGVSRLSAMGELLAQMPLFAALSPREIEGLLTKMRQETFAKDAVIIQAGQVRDRFFIITAGTVGVAATNETGETRLVARLGPGEHFGETSLLTDQPYGATCLALTNVKLLTLDEPTFDRLLSEHQSMTRYVMQISSGRTRDTRRKLS